MAGPPSRTASRQVNGVEIHERRLGHGPPIVVLHGGPGAHHDYLLPGLGALAEGRELIFYDQRGGGRSPVARDIPVGWQDAAVCVMHMQGEPATMPTDPRYDDVVAEVRGFLLARANACLEAGIRGDSICIDPRIAFGKTYQHNLELLRNQRAFTDLGYPLLIGVSRKGVIGIMTGRPASERLVGSAVAAAFAVQAGTAIIRVHDVAATVDAVKMAAALGGRGAN